MKNMFSSAQAFNQPLNNWDVSSVTTMERMFTGAQAFNQSLSCWYLIGMSNNSDENCINSMLSGTPAASLIHAIQISNDTNKPFGGDCNRDDSVQMSPRNDSTCPDLCQLDACNRTELTVYAKTRFGNCGGEVPNTPDPTCGSLIGCSQIDIQSHYASKYGTCT